MDYKTDGKDILLKQADFGLDDTLDCGQAFRWEKTAENTYSGAFLNKKLVISCENGSDLFRLHDTSEEDLLNVWADYFDLGTDYGELKKQFSEDETLSKACAYAGGIRILRQDKWEALSSFIISQNNNIPRIKGIIGRLCEHYGGYPDWKDMTEETAESLGFLRAGFRAKYLVDAVDKIKGGSIDLNKISEMEIDEARKTLMTIKGVGPKVAECALLFGFYRTEAFPKDVWVKRVMENWYPNGLPECVKGVEGIAQQYLFHYIRTSGIEV
ncbi:DNA glycosylase [Ruminococcus sp.]|uniref:DNA-3-methyladenine glycosylase family protein n=1 Tax=Ruminococcus sp. TaxID=41978 RepID=UPI0025D41A14|nr:DNA glycosylase [Ruminococcus sp.]MBQ8965398.1 DNA-3-methyladenine glycosylase 2 family protein [Ruminococcus sp.]